MSTYRDQLADALHRRACGCPTPRHSHHGGTDGPFYKDADAVLAVPNPAVEQLRAELHHATGATLCVIDAVKAHGDKAAINAVHAALAQSAAANGLDERNDLRRQVVDLRDDLEAVTAERDSLRGEVAEKAQAVVTAEFQADELRSSLRIHADRLVTWCRDDTASKTIAGSIAADILALADPAPGDTPEPESAQ